MPHKQYKQPPLYQQSLPALEIEGRKRTKSTKDDCYKSTKSCFRSPTFIHDTFLSYLFHPLEEYGAGEEIDITVTFSYPVVVLAGTVLLIDTGEETMSADATFLSGNGSASLTFLYTVAEGDHSVDLGTFEDGDAGEGGGLVGMVFRNSDNPTQVRRI